MSTLTLRLPHMPLYGAHTIPSVAKVEAWQQTKS